MLLGGDTWSRQSCLDELRMQLSNAVLFVVVVISSFEEAIGILLTDLSI